MNLYKSTFKPMLLDETFIPFNDKDYIYEIKYDGMRVLIYASSDEFKIINRNLYDVTNLFPELISIKSLVNTKTIFDGEIICIDNNYPSFSKLQQRLHLKSNTKINKQMSINPVTFIAFDIIYQNKNLDNISLIKRKEILNKIEDNKYFNKIKYIDNYGINLFKLVKKNNLEGIVAKEKSSKYVINTRSSNWIKIKNYKKEIFYIGGYYYKESSNVFSVVLGEYINKKLSFVGKVFISKRNNLFNKLKKENPIKSKFINFNEDNITYINPKYTCSVKYIERTKSNHLREPFYVK